MTKKVSVIGLGYIGLPTAAIIAQNGHQVIGVDIDKRVIDTVNSGKAHIVEKNLDQIIKDCIEDKLLTASLVVEESDIFIISVPTPFKEDHIPDLSFIHSATKLIASKIKKQDLIILESTVPIGATEQVSAWLKELRPELEFPMSSNLFEKPDVFIAHCPERVLPGNIIHELTFNDRTIGGVTEFCSERAYEFYSSFVKGRCNKTDAKTAELSKLVENSYRDVNIAFANELSLICEEFDIDVWKLIEIANCHPRVNILNPGPGVGGHCIAVDPWFIVSSSPKNSKLIKMAREVNDSKPLYVLEKIKEKIKGFNKPAKEITILTLGISFKPNIGDLRESPSFEIAKSLNNLDLKQHLIVEPNIEKIPEELLQENCQLIDLKEGLNLADLVILLVDHEQFLTIDSSLLTNKEIIDTKGVFNIGIE